MYECPKQQCNSDLKTYDYKKIDSCAPRGYGEAGMDAGFLLMKMEESDMGYDSIYDYTSELANETNEYMRNAVTDRNLNEPFTPDDEPLRNATKNSGLLNLRYNETRGTTDYQPYHPEIFIGDLNAAEDVGIKMAEAKRHTATRADARQVQMGNDNALTRPETQMSPSELSYAKKDLQKWISTYGWSWSWQSFVNGAYSGFSPDPSNVDKQQYARIQSAWYDIDDNAYQEQQFHDIEGKKKREQIGYDYRLHPFQEQTSDLTEEQLGIQQSGAAATDQAKAKYQSAPTTAAGQSMSMRNTKLMLAKEMQSAISNVQQSHKPGESSFTRQQGTLLQHKKISEISKSLMTQPKAESNSGRAIGGGLSPNMDHSKVSKSTTTTLPGYLDLNSCIAMKKATRGTDDDVRKAQNLVQQSYNLFMESKNMVAASGLADNSDRNKIMYRVEQQQAPTIDGRMLINGANPRSILSGDVDRKGISEMNCEFGDDCYTKRGSSLLPNTDPEAFRSRLHREGGFDDGSFEELGKREVWNR